MSRAERRALERCPKCENVIEEMRNARKRAQFVEGYEQAEKDLALTIEDVALLHTVFSAIDACISLGGLRVLPATEEYYEEVLKRFNERKH